MKERGPWRIWILSLLLAGNLCIPLVECQSYSGARGDEGNSPQELGFDGVLARHDGYVKGETPTIPQTSFSCSAQPYNPGLYADTETQCQVYHVCFEDRQESFLCGPGTNFNQRILACDFWYNFDCNESPSFYNVNADIGKVPDAIFNQGQSRVPGGQQPSYPNYPRQPEQPPSVGSYPPRVSVPPPPPRNQPQPPSIQPKPPKIDVPRPEIPVFQPQPEPPRVQPQPPRIQPQPPRIQPQPPRIQPQPPRIQPQPPRIQPQPPRIQPQPPRIQPQPQPDYPRQPDIQSQRPTYQPNQPSYRPQPRPDPPRVSVKPEYPSQPSGHGIGGRQPPPSIQQEEDSGYQFDGYNPPRPVALPPPNPQTPRPAFPPVVSPPRVSRPPLTPAVIRQPEGSISRPRVPATRPDFHPDSNIKGNVDYIPPQQPRIPQPSRPVGTGYPSYPVPQRPVTPVVSQRPIERPAYVPPPAIQQEHVDTEYIPPTPPKQPSRPSTSYVPPPPQPKQPSRPSYVPPPQQPKQPSRPSYVPPPQQPKQPSRPSYVPPPQQPQRPSYVPPPPQPKQPSRPSYVPPPVQQEVTNIDIAKPPQQPSRPSYVPPSVPQQPIEPDYGKQPPVAPSIISEQQKPVSRPPSRPQVTGSGRQPQRPKPVFPPPSDHPYSNIKGGPGYQQPPPQIPRFEPTRIGRPSAPQGGYVPPQPVRPRPDPVISAVKPAGEKRPSVSVSSGYKPPQQDRIKKPSEPAKEIYQPPIQVIDHPRSEIKGSDYRDSVASQQPQRIKSPSTSGSGVKIPPSKINRQQTQNQRPRAPIVVSRPQPPSLPSVDRQVYEKPAPPPSRVKQPSSSQIQRTTQPRFPSPQPVDHPNANVKGGYGQSGQQVRPQVSRPSGPPTSPSTSYEQKTTSTKTRQPAGSGYPSNPIRVQPPRGDDGQQIIQQEFKPQRISQVKTATSSGVKTASGSRPQSVSHQSVHPKQPNPNYEAGSSYTRGPEVYPKPEFGKPNAPHQPVSTPSRSSHTTKQGSSSQNTITHAENKPAYEGSPASSGFGTLVQPSYPHGGVPGHQPANQPQVFPHRENPDHPNESLKGSGAYRPPPPAGFQGLASEVNAQKAVPEPEPAATSLLGDIGAE